MKLITNLDWKIYLYQHINKTLLNDIDNIRKNYDKERSRLIDSRQNKTWADWLKQQTQCGDKDALVAMRNRKNNHDYTVSGADSDISFFNFGNIDSQSYRRRTPGSNEAAGTASGNRRSSTKSNSFSIRQGPPAKDHNSLRNLSKCDLVQLTGRGQVLLPDNAHDHLERKGFKSDNNVRWKVSRLKNYNTWK